ncbi:MAG: hypothetical protein KC478_07260 [Bacteriovoracaceae bacterium]|nr:hypothetical protein [Bacteriovoracaceae bacterium]
MKKLLAGLTLIATMTSFADEFCGNPEKLDLVDFGEINSVITFKGGITKTFDGDETFRLGGIVASAIANDLIICVSDKGYIMSVSK